jgi:hypothetical protein
MAEERGASGRSVEETSSLLPWDGFSSWINCICVVTFDLELGQALEVSMNTTCVRGSTSISMLACDFSSSVRYQLVKSITAVSMYFSFSVGFVHNISVLIFTQR